MKVIVVCASCLPLDSYSYLRGKLDKIVGGLKSLELVTRAKDILVHRYAFERRIIYQKYHSKEPLELMVEEAKAAVAFRGEKPDEQLERIVAIASGAGLKVRSLTFPGIPY